MTYLNHTEERSTFQVKLVGGALVVMFLIIGIVSIVVGRSYERDYVNENIISDHTTIHFALNNFKSYNITEAPFRFDSDMGYKTGIRYGASKTIGLKFPFLYFDQVYNIIHILSGPMIYLGEEIKENGWGGYYPQPVIAPIIMNLDPSSGGEIFLKSEIERVTITWYEIPEFERTAVNTIQLVLYENGSFDVSYIELNPDLRNRSIKIDVNTTANITGSVLGGGGNRGISFEPRLIGIHPGGRDALLHPIRFMKDLPYSSNVPGAIFEAYDIDYYNYIHNRMVMLAVVLLGSSIFILFFFPILFKSSLIKPLRVLYEGMEKAQSGDIDITISPRFNDEIGFLSRAFNRMLLSIKKAESNFRTLAQDAQDGIFILLESDIPIYANKSASAITGFDNHELMEIDFNELVQSDEFSNIKEQQRKVPEVKQISKHYEVLMKTKNGEEVSVELTVSRTTWHGKYAKVVVVRDITERKRSEEQIRQQQQQLMKMDKLTSLGILVAGVAHEINNPNQTILANASFLVRASPEILSVLSNYNEENEDFLIASLDYADFQNRFSRLTAGIEVCSNRINGIVKGLKDFSRDEPGHLMTSLNINIVVKTAIELLENYIKKATEKFSLKLEEKIPKIKGNAQRLEQVIINLTLNACQSLTNREQTISICSSCNSKKNAVLITVRDGGMGMPEEHLAKIKNPFFTTKRDQGGTGLGLYVSESIVKDHNGTLIFESHEGKGTVVTISLPVVEGL
jgi:PAS domain S-box-containing protein